MRSSLMASTSTFANLLTGRRAGAAKAKPEETDEEKAKREEEEEEAKREEEEEARAKREEEEAAAAAAAEEDDDDEKKKKEKKEARARELALAQRGDAIFSCAAAGVRPDVAAFVTFRTSLPAVTAIALLKVVAAGETAPAAQAAPTPPAAPAAPTTPPRDLRNRMQEQPQYEVGPETEPAATGAKGLAAQIIAAGQKRRGEKAA